MNEQQGESSILFRHGDKGKWQINEQELRERLPTDQADLVLLVLSEQFTDWKELPLQFEGVQRSIALADKLFSQMPDRALVLITDSGKDRAQLTRALVAERLFQLETQSKYTDHQKRIDMLQLTAKEVTDKLADSHPDTWTPYGEMIEKEGISESEAIARWINDMNKEDMGISVDKLPEESSRRYRELMSSVRREIQSDQPLILVGVGHSGSLAQIRYEEQGRKITSEETPKFCEMFKFDKTGKLLDIEEAEV